MGLIILYHLIRYYFEKNQKYKKLAKEDQKKLLELFKTNNIKVEDIGNQIILLNNFMSSRMTENDMTYDEYMKYVFPELSKFLEKMELKLYFENIPNDNINPNYMKEL